MANQEIKCNVDACRHHNNSECTLSNILVGEDNARARSKSDTICASFEAK